MDQIATTTPARAETHDLSQHAAAPRIYYVHPLLAGPLAGWQPMLDQAAALGFTHILTAPLFAGRSVRLPADFTFPHPALHWLGDAESALSHVAEMCSARGLAAMLDIDPCRVAAGGRIAAEQGGLFAAPSNDRHAALDPRRFNSDGDAAVAMFATEADALVQFWLARMARWTAAGMSGFRIMLDGLPVPALCGITNALRRNDDPLVLGWFDDPHDLAVRALRGAGLDYICAALNDRDIRDPQIWTDLDSFRQVAPVIAAVEAPFGKRLAAAIDDGALIGPAQRRAVRFAAACADGWMMPMGFEAGATRMMDPSRDVPEVFTPEPTTESHICAANRSEAGPNDAGSNLRLASAPDGDILAFLRSNADLRYADDAVLTVLNADLVHPRPARIAPFLALAGGRFEADGAGDDVAIALEPGEVRSFTLSAVPPVTLARPPLARSAPAAAASGRIGIERVSPVVDDGRFPAKRLAGETVEVTADIICDGHDQLGVALLWRPAAETAWRQTRMRPIGNDRWAGSFPLGRIGRYVFAIEAWRDAFATFRDELQKKNAAGINVEVELIEGRHLIGTAKPKLAPVAKRLAETEMAEQVSVLLSAEVSALMAEVDPRPRAVRTPIEYTIEADRAAAGFASWYEIFPRSMSDDPQRHGTFDDVIRHLPRIRDMGFDVLYFPPIHPIGRTNRKGRNNALKAGPDDPGSPYAIGAEDGGHDAIHAELGTLEDFQRMRAAAAAQGLEIALDFAIQCSPDHPWLKQHKDWFAWRPDGSMKFAENPPKKYEDIVNVDFYADGAIPDLWVGLAEVVMHWAEQGVRIFRVDNPHTKAFPFWEWMIAEIRARFPDTLFLAEAFTRPKVMNRLGKIGFSQSYTYFTWRNTKRELEDYLTELTATEIRDFFRPNFFVNTPDINPVFLQNSGRSGFLIRAALAATLSGLWGVYSGFELGESTPLPGREEYMDSEKYQIRAWDWDRAGNIVAEITELNRIRRQNPALQTHLGISFLPADNDQILLYEKATPDRSNVVIVAVSLDPMATQSANIELPLYRWGLPDSAPISVTDLMRGERMVWTGKWQRVTLQPAQPFAIWRVRPAAI